MIVQPVLDALNKLQADQDGVTSAAAAVSAANAALAQAKTQRDSSRTALVALLTSAYSDPSA